MKYLPTLTPKVIQNDPNVGKYSIHGSSGIILVINLKKIVISWALQPYGSFVKSILTL